MPLYLLPGKRAGQPVNLCPISEYKHGRYASDPVLRRYHRVFIRIELNDLYPAFVFRCQLIQDRGDHPAGTAPWRPAVNKDSPGMPYNLISEGAVCNLYRFPCPCSGLKGRAASPAYSGFIQSPGGDTVFCTAGRTPDNDIFHGHRVFSQARIYVAGAAAFRGVAGNIYEFAFLFAAGACLRGRTGGNPETAITAFPERHAALRAYVPRETAISHVTALSAHHFIRHV